MSRCDYFDLIKDLPLPTEEQTAAYADYVACSHSWYKHLPFYPPGAAFAFYLNPNAGRKVTHSCHSAQIWDVEWSDCWHYSSMPTSLFREQFGFWFGWQLDWDQPLRNVDDHKLPVIERVNREPVPVPEEWLQRCSCRLTAFVHDHGPMEGWNDHTEEKLKELEARTDIDAAQRASLGRYIVMLTAARQRPLGHLGPARQMRMVRKGRILTFNPERHRFESSLQPLFQEEHDYQNALLLKTLMRVRQEYARIRTPR